MPSFRRRVSVSLDEVMRLGSLLQVALCGSYGAHSSTPSIRERYWRGCSVPEPHDGDNQETPYPCNSNAALGSLRISTSCAGARRCSAESVKFADDRPNLKWVVLGRGVSSLVVRHACGGVDGRGSRRAAAARTTSTLVETAGQTLLAAFLVDEGRLATLLAEVADGFLSRERRPPGLGRALDLTDVLGQGPSDRVGQ